MIKFITEDKAKKDLYFEDVETDQFFVNCDGHLCQKSCSSFYNTIANESGVPDSNYVEAETNEKIKKILEYIEKIDWS